MFKTDTGKAQSQIYEKLEEELRKTNGMVQFDEPLEFEGKFYLEGISDESTEDYWRFDGSDAFGDICDSLNDIGRPLDVDELRKLLAAVKRECAAYSAAVRDTVRRIRFPEKSGLRHGAVAL